MAIGKDVVSNDNRRERSSTEAASPLPSVVPDYRSFGDNRLSGFQVFRRTQPMIGAVKLCRDQQDER